MAKWQTRVVLIRKVGALGAANSPCKPSMYLRDDGVTCVRDDECVSASCISGTCGVSPKECPSNCTGDQHGSCIYLDWNGARIRFCNASSEFCQAKWICRAGWFGSDCSMDNDAYSKSVELRERMCVSFFEAKQIQVYQLVDVFNVLIYLVGYYSRT